MMKLILSEFVDPEFTSVHRSSAIRRLFPRVASTAVVFMMSACGGGGDSSGLATLADETSTAVGAGAAVQSGDAAESGGSVGGSGEDAAGGADAAEPADVAADPETAELDDASDEERLLAFAECMRDNGVDFPDPVVEADGTVVFGRRPGSGGAPGFEAIGRDPALPAAREACSSLLQGLAFGPGRGGNFDETELQDSLLEFARCMRDNGIDMGDPDFGGFRSGGGGDQLGGPFAGIFDLQASGADDDEVGAAAEVCREEIFLRGGARVPGAAGR